ncbi:FAD/NAD(P)-binding protein [Corynebacterium pacaense]|uniref:FAD/NAD(P)-binding protein n=1 Tax=Corynebacterium pacaense TaxID=1816684 RepID=UPI0009BA525E|nr:FAD/NAD(P)-binding protein [Corynebacterium pacaense]
MSSIAFVGGGPRTTGILLRLAASVADSDRRLREIHVIDPFPAGSGRIWRRRQSGLLWMNSMAQDVSIFADESVEMEGRVIPGPTLEEWVLGPGRTTVLGAGLGAELEGFSGRSFASRRIQSLYLDWAFREAVNRLEHLPQPIRVQILTARALEVIDVDAEQVIRLSDGGVVTAAQVVLAQGHLDVLPSAESSALASLAATEGLSYVPPGFTADQDLSVVPSSRPVIVRGFGLAFIDAMVLLTEGRGGYYIGSGPGLEYVASGDEPEIWVGSGRGVPLLPKIAYSVPVLSDPPLYLDDHSLSAFGDGLLGYHEHLLPLLTWNLEYAHYSQLARTDPSRIRVPWEEFSAQLHRILPAPLGGGAESIADYVAAAVPHPADRFSFDRLNRPLDGLVFSGRAALEESVGAVISSRIERAADPRYSMDQAVFFTLLRVYFRVHELAGQGRFSLIDLRENIDRSLHRLFSYIASGPPPVRLEQLLALHRAGVLRFLGPDLSVGIEDGLFTASSPALPGDVIHATALIDAYLADDAASAVDDELLQRLLGDGEVTVESPGGPVRGKFVVDTVGRPLRADGTVHTSRYLLGPMVSGGGSEAPFSRPGTNSRGFQRADQLARRLLGLAGTPGPGVRLATSSRHPD